MDRTGAPSRLARLGRWLAVVAFSVLVLIVGLGVIGGALGPPQPAPTIPSPPAGSPSFEPSPLRQRVVVETLSRRLVVEPYLTGQMPADPFTLNSETGSTKGLFKESLVMGVAGTAGPKPSLPAGLVLADMDPVAVVRTDLGGSAQGIAVEFGRRLYSALTDLQVSEVRADALYTIGSMPAQAGHAVISGTLSDGTRERVELVVTLVAEPNGRFFGLIQIRPDRPAARAVFPALDAAAGSLAPLG